MNNVLFYEIIKLLSCLAMPLKADGGFSSNLHWLRRLFQYLEMQDHSRALTAYRTAVSQNPSHALSWNNMIILLDSLGRLPEAEEAAREALKRIRSDSVTTRGSQRSAIKAGSVAELEFHLANTLGKMERFKEAEEHFKKAIELKPRHASYYSNLGQ